MLCSPAWDSSFSTEASLTNRTSSRTSKWNNGPLLPLAFKGNNYVKIIIKCPLSRNPYTDFLILEIKNITLLTIKS